MRVYPATAIIITLIGFDSSLQYVNAVALKNFASSKIVSNVSQHSFYLLYFWDCFPLFMYLLYHTKGVLSTPNQFFLEFVLKNPPIKLSRVQMPKACQKVRVNAQPNRPTTQLNRSIPIQASRHTRPNERASVKIIVIRAFIISIPFFLSVFIISPIG